MNILAVALALSTVADLPPAVPVEQCTLQTMWDRERHNVAGIGTDPGFVPIADVDRGELLTTVTEWIRARKDGNINQLLKLTIPLPDQYEKLNRKWLENDVSAEMWYDAKPLIAQLDASNPQHVRVLSEVAVHTGGGCVVTVFGGSWVKLDGRWRAFPGGVRTL